MKDIPLIELWGKFEQISVLTLIFMVSFIVTYVLIPALIKFANRKQLFDKPDERKIHTKKISSLGGVAIILGFLASSLFWLKLGFFAFESFFLISLIILFLLGLIDDMKQLSPKIRFLGQILAGLIISTTGLRIESLHGVLGVYELSPFFQYVFSLFLIVGVINALNMIDGIDGLAGGLSVIVFAFFAFLFIIQYEWVFASICISFSASILAFLRYNFNPAKIFMGDSGSLVLGFVLTISGIKLISVNTLEQPILGYSESLILVFGALVLPVYDTLRVFSVRLLNKKSPFYPDNNHIQHLILKAGYGHKKTALVLYGINIILLASSYFLMTYQAGFSVLFLIIETVVLYELLVIKKLVFSLAIGNKALKKIRTYEVQNRLLMNHFEKK